MNPPQKALDRFVQESALEKVGLEESLAALFSVAELKRLCQERGLKVSGKKADQARRLTETDPGGMQKLTNKSDVFICFGEARKIVEQYKQAEKQRREKTEQAVRDALKNRNYRQASLAVDTYERECVFPRHNYYAEGAERDLKHICESRPGILVSISDDVLAKFREPAGQMLLWGKNNIRAWKPDDLGDEELPFDIDTTARMLVFYARNKSTLEGYTNNSDIITAVQISTAGDGSCESCRMFEGKTYPISRAPELPHSECSNEMGCRCVYIAKTILSD